MIFVADVCDTLFYSNTTMEYCKYVLKMEKKSLSLALLNFMLSKKSPAFYFLSALEKVTDRDLIKSRVIYLLKGISKTQLDQHAESFVKEVLAKKRIGKVFSLLNEYKGARLILLSSSLDPVVGAIAADLGAEFASSRLEYKEDICTGKIIFELKGKKHEVLAHKFGSRLGELLVISDNFSDEELMKLGNYRYAVVYNDKQKLFWKKLNAKIIEVNER